MTRRISLTAAIGGMAACVCALMLASPPPGTMARPLTRRSRPPVTMPAVTAVGTRLMLGNDRFHVYGFNYDFNGTHPDIDYINHPDRAHLLRLRRDFATAARLGANTMRIYLELHDFMASPKAARPRALHALRSILGEAQRAGLLLDVTGDLVWHPEDSPAWYEALGERARWRVQARFWRAVARVGERSPAILCYELTSEPAIGDSDSWYTGVMIHHYIQYVVRHLAGRDGRVLARAWTLELRNAIRREDPRHLITIGLLPTRGGPFDPANVADLLDLITIHEYPGSAEAAKAIKLVRYFARQGRPLLLGETFMVDRAAEEDFLFGARRWLDGALSFFDGRAPEDAGNSTIVDALYRENLIAFLGLRATLGASPRVSIAP